jgi:hypothetical protein
MMNSMRKWRIARAVLVSLVLVAAAWIAHPRWSALLICLAYVCHEGMSFLLFREGKDVALRELLGDVWEGNENMEGGWIRRSGVGPGDELS